MNLALLQKLAAGEKEFSDDEIIWLAPYYEYFARKRDLPLLHMIMKSYPSVERNKDIFFLILKSAILDGDIESFKQVFADLASKNPEMLKKVITHSDFALFNCACDRGGAADIIAVVAEGLKKTDAGMYWVMMAKAHMGMACEQGDVESVKTILNLVKGDKAIYRDVLAKGNYDAFRWACRQGHEELVELLIDAARQLGGQDLVKEMILASNNMAFTWAHEQGHSHIIERLLKEFSSDTHDTFRKLMTPAAREKPQTVTPASAATSSAPPVEDQWAAVGKEAPHPWLRELSPHNFNHRLYQELLPLMYIASRMEKNNNETIHSYKLATLFANYDKVDQYLKRWSNEASAQPIHDACLFELPKKGKWNKAAWQDLMLKHGPEIKNCLTRASDIQQYLGRPPKNAKEAKEIMGTFKYGRGEYPQLAELCARYGVSTEGYAKGEQALQNIKKADYIPDIGFIDGADIGLSGFYMQKLEPADPRALVIGHMVDCCNHLDGQTAALAIAHVTSPYSGVYAVFKKSSKEAVPNPANDEIVAKISPWFSHKRNVVFNAWERLGAYNYLGQGFIEAAAKKILQQNPNINKILLGRSVTHTDVLSFPPLDPQDTEVAIDAASASYDSQRLSVVMTQRMLALRPDERSAAAAAVQR